MEVNCISRLTTNKKIDNNIKEVEESFEMWYWCKDLNKHKTIIKVRGSSNGISNKYSINSFYYLTRNHTQKRFHDINC
jgi:hypothetical protein